jgi:hypothetical protein
VSTSRACIFCGSTTELTRAKTGMTMEQAATGPAVIPDSQRRHLAHTSRFPARLQVFVGGRASGGGLVRWDQQPIAGEDVIGVRRPGYASMIAVGGLFAFALSVPDFGEGVDTEPEVLLDPARSLGGVMARVTQVRRKFDFPPPHVLHDPEIDDLFAGLSGQVMHAAELAASRNRPQ